MKRGLKITLLSIIAFVLVVGIAIAILIHNVNKIIKHELESALGEGFSVRKIDLRWGRVEAFDISFKNPVGKEVFKTESLILNADFTSILRKKYIISNLNLKNPYIILETDNKGNLIAPFPQKEPTKEMAEKPLPPIVTKKIEIKNGALDYLDRKVSKTPVLTKLRDIELEFKDIAIPLGDNFSTYTLSANVPGNQSIGILKSKGKIKPKTRDMDCKVEIRKLDITAFKPYYQKKSDVNVTKGTLDLDMDTKVKSRKINAPGRAVLKDLDFEKRPGLGGTFLNIPLSAVILFLKKNNNEIVVNFVMEGDLDNPKFTLREGFMDKIAIAMAEQLGLSVKRIGESIVIFGAEGTKEGGKGVKDIGESIKKIFK
jgi:uncharacterized protein involved in outer membrane biogenesis